MAEGGERVDQSGKVIMEPKILKPLPTTVAEMLDSAMTLVPEILGLLRDGPIIPDAPYSDQSYLDMFLSIRGEPPCVKGDGAIYTAMFFLLQHDSLDAYIHLDGKDTPWNGHHLKKHCLLNNLQLFARKWSLELEDFMAWKLKIGGKKNKKLKDRCRASSKFWNGEVAQLMMLYLLCTNYVDIVRNCAVYENDRYTLLNELQTLRAELKEFELKLARIASQPQYFIDRGEVVPDEFEKSRISEKIKANTKSITDKEKLFESERVKVYQKIKTATDNVRIGYAYSAPSAIFPDIGWRSSCTATYAELVIFKGTAGVITFYPEADHFVEDQMEHCLNAGVDLTKPGDGTVMLLSPAGVEHSKYHEKVLNEMKRPDTVVNKGWIDIQRGSEMKKYLDRVTSALNQTPPAKTVEDATGKLVPIPDCTLIKTMQDQRDRGIAILNRVASYVELPEENAIREMVEKAVMNVKYELIREVGDLKEISSEGIPMLDGVFNDGLALPSQVAEEEEVQAAFQNLEIPHQDVGAVEGEQHQAGPDENQLVHEENIIQSTPVIPYRIPEGNFIQFDYTQQGQFRDGNTQGNYFQSGGYLYMTDPSTDIWRQPPPPPPQ